KLRVEACKSTAPLEKIKALATKSDNPFAFEKALATNDIAFICEVKKASPSKGIIAGSFPYLQIAKDYQAAGASAISVLTEPSFFLGSNEYLEQIKQAVNIPILRKDFIIDEYQIYESRMIGADAILLICSILASNTIKAYIEIADQLGMSCLVEAHDEAEIKSAISVGARVIGVNNRNLKTFEVDITNSINLRKLVPTEIIFVSESGISTASDIKKLRENGTNAVLIGETLMRSENKKRELDKLRGFSNA
ncbi:MAG: indole-3-glycerol phosphate synthase TrpC, partial [Sporomusa sp.]